MISAQNRARTIFLIIKLKYLTLTETGFVIIAIASFEKYICLGSTLNLFPSVVYSVALSCLCLYFCIPSSLYWIRRVFSIIFGNTHLITKPHFFSFFFRFSVCLSFCLSLSLSLYISIYLTFLHLHLPSFSLSLQILLSLCR